MYEDRVGIAGALNNLGVITLYRGRKKSAGSPSSPDGAGSGEQVKPLVTKLPTDTLDVGSLRRLARFDTVKGILIFLAIWY